MIKKEITGMSIKEQLKARANNKLYNFILENGQIRGAVLHGTFMINEMRANHELGILETLVLGHAYLGAGLMTANLKEHDSIAFKIECEGPIKGLSVETNAFGEVRGYLKNNPIPIDKPLESFDLAPFLGTGFLEVTHYPEYAKHPYVGRVKLIEGSIAANLANYFLTSEQTPSAFNLSIKFDAQGNVTGAGGIFLQTLPGADEKRIDELEQLIHQLPSIGETFAGGQIPENFILNQFHSFSPKLLHQRRIDFHCPCSKETIGQFIAGLSKDHQKDILGDTFPIEIRCHNCNTVYSFAKVPTDRYKEEYAGKSLSRYVWIILYFPPGYKP
ncbi:MAG: Hsp33 family molecular chaperone HslO [Acidobacteria bacterium]|nr:Hsp33 family molecular chaperone HslO [Acidobacteriota bacterium]